MTNANLEAMIKNLGVIVSDDDKQKLAKLTFSQYSRQLQDADININAATNDNDLKLELLRLQVHYLHNLDAVRSAETDKRIATAGLNKEIEALGVKLLQAQDHNKSLTDVQTKFETVKKQLYDGSVILSEKQAELSEKQAELIKERKESTDKEVKLKTAENHLKVAEDQLKSAQARLKEVEDKYAALQTALQIKAKVLTNAVPSLPPVLRENPAASLHQNQPTHQLQLHQKPIEKRSDVILKPEEIVSINDLKIKLGKSNFLEHKEFNTMFTIMYNHNVSIKKFLPDKKPVTGYYFTNDSSSPNIYFIHILLQSSNLNIKITDKPNECTIGYYNYITSPATSTVITPNLDIGVSGTIDALNKREVFKLCYQEIIHLLDFLFLQASKTRNKYLKYKNKYLQLKKLYNL
jgi:hypothetical protein